MLSVAIVEDNRMVCDHLQQCMGADSEVRATAYYSADTALAEITAGNVPDIVLMDISLSRSSISGIDLTRQLRAAYPEIKIIINSIYTDEYTVIKAIKAGASGYIAKEDSLEPAKIKKILTEVYNGDRYCFYSDKITYRMQEYLQKRNPSPIHIDPDYNLTDTEEKILHDLLKGSSNKEIAHNRGSSERTIEVHLSHIYDKLSVKSREEAIKKIDSDTERYYRKKWTGD